MLPKLIRPFFRFHCRYLGELCRLVADGVFLPSGTFRVLPPLPETAFCNALRHKVLDFLSAEGVLNTAVTERMRQWCHSGFFVHNRIRTQAADAEGRQRLARYMTRCPFALKKMSNDGNPGTVINRSSLHAKLKHNYQLVRALLLLHLLLNHVPDKYEHLVRHYGYYSNRSRGAPKLAQQEHDTSTWQNLALPFEELEQVTQRLEQIGCNTQNVCAPL